MTDNEIVKALECMATNDLYNGDMQTASICLHAKETIERRKAEIEELQEINKSLKEDRPFLIAVARAEAIKEFAERLKDNNFKVPVDAFTSAYVLGDDDIDQIAKEMGQEG